MIALATDYLTPAPSVVVLVVLYVGLFVVWPFVQALRAGRFLWAIAVLLFAPVGAILWWTVGRRTGAVMGPVSA